MPAFLWLLLVGLCLHYLASWVVSSMLALPCGYSLLLAPANLATLRLPNTGLPERSSGVEAIGSFGLYVVLNY